MSWRIEFKHESLKDLKLSLDQGPIFLLDGEEVQSLNEVFIAAVGSLKIFIYSDEHPPPHFHVKYNGEENSFSIIDGSPLYPNNGLKKYFRNIKKWFNQNKDLLKDTWNENRPSDCPVGCI
jgi:hypothetical protein